MARNACLARFPSPPRSFLKCFNPMPPVWRLIYYMLLALVHGPKYYSQFVLSITEAPPLEESQPSVWFVPYIEWCYLVPHRQIILFDKRQNHKQLSPRSANRNLRSPPSPNPSQVSRKNATKINGNRWMIKYSFHPMYATFC